MTQLSQFQGHNEDALSWLTQMDHIVILRARDHEKIQLFRDKLTYRSPAEAWFFKLPKELTTHWEVVRELFVAKWVEKLDDEGMTKKMAELTQATNPLRAKTATLDTFSITTEERPSSQAHRALKKLINDILDCLDDEQAPATLQNLNDSVFIQGFRTGYREAYKQWGEEAEERLDEAYQGGIKDERKRWKETQTNTEPRDAPTPATATVETAVQTNPAPDRQCAAMQAEPTMTNSSTQTMANRIATLSTQTTSNTTADTAAQTTPLTDETPTKPSPPTTPAQPPSMSSTLSTSSTTATTTPSTTSNQPKTPQKRRHTLPSRLIDPQKDPQPLLLSPKPRRSTVTPLTTSTATLVATTSKTTIRVSSHTKTMATTPETTHKALNDTQSPSTAQQPELCDDEQLCSPKRDVCSMERPCQPSDPQRRPVLPPRPLCSPQSVPLPVPHLERSKMTAMSSSTCPSMMVEPLAMSHPGPRMAAVKRRDTLPGLPEHLQNTSERPCLPPNPPKQAVSLSPTSYTPAVSLTTLSTPVAAPRSLPPPLFPPAHPCSPLLDHKRAVSPPPVRFDWAEDATSLPTAPRTQLRDFSALRTGCTQLFGTLRRRTRRR